MAALELYHGTYNPMIPTPRFVGDLSVLQAINRRGQQILHNPSTFSIYYS